MGRSLEEGLDNRMSSGRVTKCVWCGVVCVCVCVRACVHACVRARSPGFVNLVVLNTGGNLQIFRHNFSILSEKNIIF